MVVVMVVVVVTTEGLLSAATLHVRDSIVVSISACHAEVPGSIPGRGSGETPLALCLTERLRLSCGAPAPQVRNASPSPPPPGRRDGARFDTHEMISNWVHLPTK